MCERQVLEPKMCCFIYSSWLRVMWAFKCIYNLSCRNLVIHLLFIISISVFFFFIFNPHYIFIIRFLMAPYITTKWFQFLNLGGFFYIFLLLSYFSIVFLGHLEIFYNVLRISFIFHIFVYTRFLFRFFASVFLLLLGSYQLILSHIFFHFCLAFLVFILTLLLISSNIDISLLYSLSFFFYP